MRNNDEYPDIELPEWLRNELPEKKKIHTITWSEEHSGFYIKELESPTYYNDAYDLYTIIRKDRNVDLALDPSIDGKHGVEYNGGFGRVNHKLMVISTDSDKEFLLKMDYSNWVNIINVNYLNDPKNPCVSYEWLVHHPVFWWRYSLNKTFDWNTNMGLANSYEYIGNHKGKPIIYIEVGEHTPNYTEHYHNIHLDTSARSFDKLYVKLAARINKSFNYDGSAKESLN